jgi:tRNA1Val (adenine37-N6)-methyltransferase
MSVSRRTMVILHKDETIEDLQLNGIRMIQKREGFRFGEDSVLLANFVAESFKKTKDAKRNIIDLGCNCGSISLLLSQKLAAASITGVEITKAAYDAFLRNIELNNLKSSLSALNKNWNDLKSIYKPGKFDCVVSNPPYKIFDGDKDKEITDKRIAREELFSSLSQLLDITSYLLRPRGTVFMIYRTDRLIDLVSGLRNAGIEPRSLRFVHPFIDRAPTAFIISGQKGVNPGGFVAGKPLILFDKPGVYRTEVLEMYGKTPSMTKEKLFEGIVCE